VPFVTVFNIAQGRVV